MHRTHRVAPAALATMLAAMLAGCAATTVETTAPPGYVADAAARTASVDWARAEPVTVAMVEYGYQPAALAFAAGRPYRLRIENHGGSSHTFSSDGFFQAIAARSLTTVKGTVDTPYVRDVEVAPGQAADLLFVPVRAGDYPLVCHEPLHEVFGMTGTIRIR